MSATWTFNPDQLASWTEAKALALQINEHPFFKQANVFVAPESGDVNKAGIYVPSWDGGPGGFPEPSGDGTYWLHFRFTNGFSGMNVGLARDEFNRYPSSPLYVMGWLLAQVQQGLGG